MLMRLFAAAAVWGGATAQAQPVWEGGFEPEDIVVFWSCASDCNADRPPEEGNPGCMSHGLERPGEWPRLMSTRIYADYQDGFRRFLLHLPFGNLYLNGGMDLDMPLDNLEAGLGHINRDFFEALHWAETHMPDAEFIVYLGSRDHEMKEALENDDRYHDHWQRLIGAGWNMLFLDFPSTSIGFDAGVYFRNGIGGNWAAGDPYFQFLKLIQSYKALQGRRVYIEAMPQNRTQFSSDEAFEPFEWHRTMPWIALEDAFARQIKRWVNHDPPLETPEGIRCLIRRMDLDLWEDKGGALGWAAHCISHGHTPAINRQNPMFPWYGLNAQETAKIMARNLE